MTLSLLAAQQRRPFRDPGNDFELRPAARQDEVRVRQLIFSVLVEFGLEVEPDGADRDLFDLTSYYDQRGGVLWLACADKRLLGTVALLPRQGEEIEFRRLYLDPAARGSGLGSRLLDYTIELARDCGYRSMVLDTATVLERAIALYLARGFIEDDSDRDCGQCDQRFRLIL